MGRSRRRQRRDDYIPRPKAPAAKLRAKFTPTFVSVKPNGTASDPVVDAPVLALEGLDPWSPITGPALMLEEPPEESDEPCGTCASPDQLELEAWRSEAVEVAENTQAVVPAAATPAAPVPAAPLAAAAAPAAEPVYTPPAPDASDILYGRARAAAEEDRTAEAIGLYRELLAQNPRHLRGRNNLALLLDAEGNHQGALGELDRALEIDPEHTTLLTNRGAMLGAQGRYAAAERDLRRVLRVEPSNVEALFNLGVVMTKKGLWSEAVPHLLRATELDQERAAAFYYLGEALNHVDDLAGALTAYQRAAELQPSNARALYGLGIIYDRLARPDDAAVMYRKSREVARR